MNNKVIKQESSIEIKQHNNITGASYDMSALEKNIVYMFLAQLNDSDSPDKMYSISIKSLKQKLKELGQEIDLKHIEEATGKLVTRAYSIESDSGDHIKMSLFASVEYTTGSDLIEIELSETIRHYLFDLKYDFTTYKRDMALSLRSKYSKRIYEMLSQHKNVGIFKISVQDLKKRLKIIDRDTETQKFKTWSSFYGNVLELAKREINEKTDLSATYTLKKTGRRYSDIEFRISTSS